MATTLLKASRTPSDRLISSERAKLLQLEDVLETARRWQIEEAKAFLEIRERRLWRGSYATFEEYGQHRWQIEHSRLYQLCSWGEVLRNLSTVVETYPERESHARPLYGLTAEQQRKAWKLACRGGRANSMTALRVSEAVTNVLGRKHQPATPLNCAKPTGKIVHADAIAGVSQLEDGSVDLFMFSPPYCEQRNGHYPGVAESEYPQWMAHVMRAITPKLKPQGSVLIVAREHVRKGQISDVWLRTRLAVRETGWLEIDTLIWQKPDAPPLGRVDRPRRVFEFVYWFARNPKPFVDVYACGTVLREDRSRMLRPRQPKRTAVFGDNRERLFARFRSGDRARVTDVINATIGGGVPEGVNHSAVYPMGLCKTLIETFSPRGGLVADCFAGSGTTLVAARDSGRRWWGCDVVQDYVKDAARRLKKSPDLVRS